MTQTRSSRLPPAESSAFGGAVLNSYTYGYLIGLGWMAMAFLKADMKPEGHHYFLTALGVSSTGWATAWGIALCFVASVPVSAAALVYHRFTGRTFLADRIGFAKAGGQDIGSVCGSIAVIAVVAVFAALVPPVVPAWLRIPGIMISAAWLGSRAASALAWRVFTALFGPPPSAAEEGP